MRRPKIPSDGSGLKENTAGSGAYKIERPSGRVNR
jgi:hypothetical protein